MAKQTMQTRAGQSVKHLIIDKANSTMVIAVSIAVFVVVFCGFAVRALVSQSLYHQRVIAEKKEALGVLQNNKTAADELAQTYESFATAPVNVLGGNPDGKGARDGDNAQIVLDALPSVYDYPALSSSIEKILVDGGYQITSIGGSEDSSQSLSLDQEATVVGKSEPVEIPYPFSIESDPEGAQKLLKTLESSIRPFYVDSLRLSGQGTSLSMDVGLKTFYQPASGLEISTKEVR